MKTITIKEYFKLNAIERARLEVLGFTLDASKADKDDIEKAILLKKRAINYLGNLDGFNKVSKMDNIKDELRYLARRAEDLAEMHLSTRKLKNAISNLMHNYARVYGDLVKLEPARKRHHFE